ncbi:DUF6527 family protein [Draconibacterium orientale]|uniref:DUF6527 family protein n=1 Tax=Draconibacterium orientale TaxID=1168034 RepID=UPI00374A335E
MRQEVKFKFVKTVPDSLDEGTVYITTHYNTAIHKCMCGCGNEVVTPFSPNDWSLCYDGESISLSPSIGNWSFECQSHYWIESNTVIWDKRWSSHRIERNRNADLRDRKANDNFSRNSKGWLSVLYRLFSFFHIKF